MATDLARQAAAEGCDVVVNCGGDGTLREIVNGLVGTNTAIGCLPGGTVNLWTKELGISPRLEVATLQLIGGVRRRVDVGRVKINDGKSHHFLLMAGLGLDGTIMSRVSKALKNRIGKLAVGLAGLRSVPTFKPVPLQLEMGGIKWEGSSAQVIVGNTRLYGGFSSFTPQAYVDDGLLDICLLTTPGPLMLARQIIPLLFFKHPNFEQAEIYRSGQITLRTPKPLPLQLDGGAVKFKDKSSNGNGVVYRFSVIAKGVTVLVPPAYNDTLFVRTGDVSEVTELNSNLYAVKEKRSKNHIKPKEDKAGDKTDHETGIEVLELGVNTITGVKLKNGKVVIAVVDAETNFKANEETVTGVTTIMSVLQVGDRLKVRGPREQPKGKILARQITILAKGDLMQPDQTSLEKADYS